MKLITKARRPNPLSTKMARELLQDLLNSEELDLFLESSKDGLISLHHTLGRHIRNTYIYIDDDFMKPYPDEYIDDVSFEIITELQELLKDLRKDGQDLNYLGLEREIQKIK